MITPSSPFTTIINYDHLGYDEDGDGDNNIDNDGDLQHDAVRQAISDRHIHILTHFQDLLNIERCEKANIEYWIFLWCEKTKDIFTSFLLNSLLWFDSLDAASFSTW